MNVHVSERIPWRNGEGREEGIWEAERAFTCLVANWKLSVHLPNCSPSPRLLPLGDLF